MNVTKQTNWTKFKQYITDRKLSLQFLDDDNSIYELYAIDEGFIVLCIIKKDNPRNADQIDFEDNYSSLSNKNDLTIVGGTDKTIIGNIGDRLKTDTQVSVISNQTVPTYSSKLRYLDLNISNGGIARGTSVSNSTWVDIFSYSGSGMISSFLLNLEYKSDWRIRLVVDNEDIFDTNGLLTNDFLSSSIYNLDDDEHGASNMGLRLEESGNLRWEGPLWLPIKYNSSIQLKIKRETGANSKKFQAGLIVLTKET